MKNAKELKEEINDNNDYTAESHRKAKSHLMTAKTNRLNPANAAKTSLRFARSYEKAKETRKRKIRTNSTSHGINVLNTLQSDQTSYL